MGRKSYSTPLETPCGTHNKASFRQCEVTNFVSFHIFLRNTPRVGKLIELVQLVSLTVVWPNLLRMEYLVISLLLLEFC